jgi:hypothetical protein
LSLGGAAPAAPALQPGDIVRPGYAPQASFGFHTDAGAVEPQTVDIAKLVTEALAKGTARIWLDNSLVKEVRVSTKLNAQMTATFDIRVSADDQIKTDMIVANDEAFSPPRSFVYDATLRNDGAMLFEQKAISQYPYSNWHKAIWTGASRSTLDVGFDPEYLARTGAIAEYDFSLGVAARTIADEVSALASAKSGPMQPSLITPYMGTTGGRGDIGITTSWSANFLVSEDHRAKTVMLAEADAAGSVPWHLRDAATNAPISIESHPTTWADYRDSSRFGTTPGDLLPTAFDIAAASKQSGWEIDQAHEPDLAFVPYLVTGDRYYLDELESAAAFLALSGNPQYRKNGEGLIRPWNQTRGLAWNLRDIDNAAWIAPDADPLKAVFATLVANNLNDLTALIEKFHSASSEGEIEGYLPDPDHPTQTAPWQNDFVAIVMDLLARRGVAGAKSIEAWLDHYNSGRYTNGANGFNPLNGPGYWFKLADDNAARLAPNSWAHFYARNFGDQPAPKELANSPNCTFCYPAISAMASAEAFSTVGSPTALWAYAFLIANTPTLLGPSGYVADPSWHVTPVLADGYHLKSSDIHLVPDAGGAVSATGAHSVLAGGARNNMLNGGTGFTVMYAGTGPAILKAVSGISYIIAGAGEGSKKATILVDAAATAQETIMDFDPSFDTIEIGNPGGLSLSSPSWIAADGKGGTILTLGTAHKVAVLNVAPSPLTGAIKLRSPGGDSNAASTR